MLEAAELLRSYALSRGWVAASGLPDETRSGRQILKDFVNGKLLHCERPPTCALSNAQLGLTGQNAAPSRHAALGQTGASDTFALEADQAEAQVNGDSHPHSHGSESAAEQDESSDQDGSGAQSQQGGSMSADDAAVGSSSDTEAAAAAHMASLNDADRELMESMSNVQGAQCKTLLALLLSATTVCSFAICALKS